ncbi:hypothetical protein ACFWH4_01055 [Streptomyces sp. NPDC127091]|uniref:hypothetical protein n=1 Tax=Streptomyces sp. NPDC127091 TaxID=3347134 RepID=UPI003664971F
MIVDWYINLLATYGLIPVIAVEAVACVAAWCGLGAALHAAEQRRSRRALRAQLRTERQQMARLRDAITNAPQIPTQPGHDNDLLIACWDAWNADTRKEN